MSRRGSLRSRRWLRSTVHDVRRGSSPGGEALRGVEIDAGQVPVVGLTLLAPFGIRVTER